MQNGGGKFWAGSVGMGLCWDRCCQTVGFLLPIEVWGTLGVVFGESRPRPPAYSNAKFTASTKRFVSRK
jgi:hypothetical protein